jgi:hypothetical protein
MLLGILSLNKQGFPNNHKLDLILFFCIDPHVGVWWTFYIKNPTNLNFIVWIRVISHLHMSNVDSSLTRYKVFVHKDNMCKLFKVFSNKWTTLPLLWGAIFFSCLPQMPWSKWLWGLGTSFLETPWPKKQQLTHPSSLNPYVFNDKPTYNMLSTTKVTLITYSWTRSQLRTLWILNNGIFWSGLLALQKYKLHNKLWNF